MLEIGVNMDGIDFTECLRCGANMLEPVKDGQGDTGYDRCAGCGHVQARVE